MQIQRVNNQQMSKQQSFGMKLIMDADAIDIFTRWAKAKEIPELVSEIIPIKSLNGREIIANAKGDKITGSIKITGREKNGKITSDPYTLSSDLGLCSIKNRGRVVNNLIPTLKALTQNLNNKIIMSDSLKPGTSKFSKLILINDLEAHFTALNETKALLKKHFGSKKNQNINSQMK